MGHKPAPLARAGYELLSTLFFYSLSTGYLFDISWNIWIIWVNHTLTLGLPAESAFLRDWFSLSLLHSPLNQLMANGASLVDKVHRYTLKRLDIGVRVEGEAVYRGSLRIMNELTGVHAAIGGDEG